MLYFLEFTNCIHDGKKQVETWELNPLQGYWRCAQINKAMGRWVEALEALFDGLDCCEEMGQDVRANFVSEILKNLTNMPLGGSSFSRTIGPLDGSTVRCHWLCTMFIIAGFIRLSHQRGSLRDLGQDALARNKTPITAI